MIFLLFNQLTGRGVALALDVSDWGGVLFLLLPCRKPSVMSCPVVGSIIGRPRFSRFWYGPLLPVDMGRGCGGCCGGCCCCIGCCCDAC